MGQVNIVSSNLAKNFNFHKTGHFIKYMYLVTLVKRFDLHIVAHYSKACTQREG